MCHMTTAAGITEWWAKCDRCGVRTAIKGHEREAWQAWDTAMRRPDLARVRHHVDGLWMDHADDCDGEPGVDCDYCDCGAGEHNARVDAVLALLAEGE